MRTRKNWLKHHFYTARRLQFLRKKIHELINDKTMSTKHRRRLYTIESMIESPRCLLDDHYHEIINNHEFNLWGHIYYNAGGKKEKRGR